MPKVELLAGMSYIEGWPEVAKLVEEKMKEWGDELKDWKVHIRMFTEEDAKRGRFGGEDFLSNKDAKRKILTVAFRPDPVEDPEVETDLIMQEFVGLEEEDEH